MKEYIINQIKDYEGWLESEDMELIEEAMVDIVAESYLAYGECDELDKIFKDIGWIDDDGDLVFENYAGYRRILK